MSTSNPRRSAFEILLRIEKERSYADILIDRELSTGALQGPDRRLLTELVYGVLRRRGTLDHIIDQFSKQHVDKLERVVLVLLRLGLYQEYFLDRIPVSAAVNETVGLAHSFAPRAAGFINAILRRADRERDLVRYPDRSVDPVGSISSRFSNPAWITEVWIDQLGVEEAEALARVNLTPPPLTVRVNTLKTTRESLIERLATEGIPAAAARYSPYALHLSGAINLATLASFEEGLFTVQDESSQLAALFLAPRPGERVIDLCAAPGGKSTFLAQLMEDRGTVLACDVSPRKLQMVEQTAHRLGITIIRTCHLDACKPFKPLPGRGIAAPARPDGARGGGSPGFVSDSAVLADRFDRILVDAPCSGLGVLRRNPEGKWWKTPQDVAELVRVQKQILANAAGRLEDDGAMLYATCSTTVEENEAVIDDFLSRKPGFMLEDLRKLFPDHAELFTDRGCFRSWPHRHGMDGFFAARLKKK